jgi:hypothetical protein
MIEVTAFNWTYWVKTIFESLILLALVLTPIQIYWVLKTDKLIGYKESIIIIIVTITTWFLYSSYRLPGIKNDFKENKLVLSGSLCGFKGAREWYTICVDGKIYKSKSPARSMMNDAIFNFGWMEKPKECIEMEYLNLGEVGSIRAASPYTNVAIGRIREIPCIKSEK